MPCQIASKFGSEQYMPLRLTILEIFRSLFSNLTQYPPPASGIEELAQHRPNCESRNDTIEKKVRSKTGPAIPAAIPVKAKMPARTFIAKIQTNLTKQLMACERYRLKLI